MRNTITALSLVFAMLVTVLAFMSSTSLATETRVQSMGGVGFYVKDNSNVFLFPGTIHTYRNQVISELRVKNITDQYTIGTLMPLGDNTTGGLYLNRPLMLPAEELSQVAPDVELRRATSLLLGTSSQDMNFGIAFTFALDKYTDQDEFGDEVMEENESAHYFGIAAGLSNSQYDLGALLELPGVKWEYEDASRTWGGFGIGLNGRYFVQQTQQLAIVPLGRFYLGSSKYEEDSGIAGVENYEEDFGRLELALGVGFNYTLTEQSLFVLGIEAFGLDQETDDVKDGDKTTERNTTLPGIYMGVESAVKPWLIIRMGASQVYQSYLQKTEPNEGDTVENSDHTTYFNFTFGFGIKISTFLLDASFNEGFLFDGPNFLSGTTNALANRISLTYQF